MQAAYKQIQRFLAEYKKAVEVELTVIPREINREFLTKNGFTAQERKEVLLGLQVKDYSKGPEGDDRARGRKDIWFFGVDYRDISIYIKLQLVEEKDEKTKETTKHAKCLAFHQAKWPTRHPYKR